MLIALRLGDDPAYAVAQRTYIFVQEEPGTSRTSAFATQDTSKPRVPWLNAQGPVALPCTGVHGHLVVCVKGRGGSDVVLRSKTSPTRLARPSVLHLVPCITTFGTVEPRRVCPGQA